MSRRILVALLAALLLGACSPREEPLYQNRILAFGTLVDLTLYGVKPELAQEAATRMTQEFTLMNDAWHAWRPSTLGTFNEECAAGQPFKADPKVLPLVVQSKALAEASGGLFDPAAGRLFALWHFQRDDPHGTPPDAATVAALVAQHPAMSDIEIHGETVTCHNPAVKLDLGGFAKGYGVDRIIDMLRGMGIRNAIVNAGGDLRAIGSHGKRPWRIGVQDPRGEGTVLASIDVRGDESVFTSGDYERYYVYEGQRYHHILDPRTGYPSRGATSVTVIHGNGAEADAAATALMVAGPKEWEAVARNMGIKYVMLVDSEGTVHMNPAMAGRVHFEESPAPKVVLSPEL